MALRKYYILLIFAGFMLSGFATLAQEKQGANWFFGYKKHMDFNFPNPPVNSYTFIPVDSLAQGIGGAAAISDKNGDLLFFTSGGKIATRQKINGVYQPMPNGQIFSGKVPDLLYSEMIVQSPGDSNIYYLFFTKYERAISNSLDLYWLQVDMRLNKGYGDVVPNSLQRLKKNANPYNLSAFLHQNNRDTWVMAANPGSLGRSDTLISYLVTPGGIMPPVKTKVTIPFTSSRMKASPDSERFAVTSSPTVGSSQTLDLYDFNRATGVPTFKYSLPNPDMVPHPNPSYPFFAYAFSPNGSKLYVGNSGSNGNPKNARVYQYDLTAGTPTQVDQSRNLLYHATNFQGVYDLQLAINGKIYLYTTPTHLSLIHCPDFYGQACNLQVDAVDLKGHTEGISLPTLNQTIFRNAGILQAQATRSVICEGDTVQLSAYGAGAEQFRWKPANGLTASSETSANPLVHPSVTTTYQVIGSSTCDSDTAFVKVTVLPKPKPSAIAGPQQVHTFAEKQQYAVQNATAGSKYAWEITGGTIVSGQGQSSIVVNWGDAGPGTIKVLETNAAGCKWETARLEVKISGKAELRIYNVLTPNSDGKNEAFFIENLKWYPENELKIYNRWGQEVFSASNYQNNWDAGKVSGGTYYYVFKADGRKWKGWVEVLK